MARSRAPLIRLRCNNVTKIKVNSYHRRNNHEPNEQVKYLYFQASVSRNVILYESMSGLGEDDAHCVSARIITVLPRLANHLYISIHSLYKSVNRNKVF